MHQEICPLTTFCIYYLEGIRMNMSAYNAYWKRGWWAWLMMLIANISVLVAALPFAWIFADNQVAYYTITLCLWLVVWTPFLGWLFEKFAQNSERLTAATTRDDSIS